MNTGGPVRRMGFFGPAGEGIFCFSCTEEASFWHYPSAQRLLSCADLRQQFSIDYLIDCLEVGVGSTSNNLVGVGAGVDLVMGTYDGKGLMCRVNPGCPIQVTGTLEGGHSGVIRTCSSMSHQRQLITGGEDARLCVWNLDAHVNPYVNGDSVFGSGPGDVKGASRMGGGGHGSGGRIRSSASTASNRSHAPF